MAAAVERATAMVLAALAGLHVAWGRGSSVPFASRGELADAVMGTSEVPSPRACFAVAGALATGCLLVLDPVPLPVPVRRGGLLTMSTVLATRAALGWSGRTELVSPGSSSPRFLRLDRRLYSPVCAALAVGGLLALRPHTRLERGGVAPALAS